MGDDAIVAGNVAGIWFSLVIIFQLVMSGYTIMEHNHFGEFDPIHKVEQPVEEDHPHLCRLLHFLYQEASYYKDIFSLDVTYARSNVFLFPENKTKFSYKIHRVSRSPRIGIAVI